MLRSRFQQVAHGLRSGSFGRHVAILAGGTALAQGVTVALSPIITRLYRPDDFGVLSVYAALSSIVAVVSALRFETAIPLPKEDEDAANLLALSCTLCVAMAGVVGVFVLTSPTTLSCFKSYELVGPYAYFLPFSILGSSLFQVFNYWAVRRKSFGRVARTRLTQALALLGAQALFGLLHFRPAGLLAADAIGRSTGTGTLAIAAGRNDGVWRHVTLERMRRVGREYRRFPIFSAPAAVLNALGLNMAPLLMAGSYGPHAAGEFALSQRILALPLALLGDAVSQVYVVEASRLVHVDPKGLGPLLTSTTRHLVILAILPAGIVALAGPELFRLAFGEPWSEAGEYGRVLAGMLVVQLAITPVSQTLNVLGRQDWQLFWDASRTALIFAVFALSARNGLSSRTAVMLYAAAMATAYAANFVLIKFAVKRASRSL